MPIRADLGSARLVCDVLRSIVEPRGLLVCLTGSCLFQGEGNDVDVLLVPTPDLTIRPEDLEDVLRRELEGRGGFVVMLSEENERGFGFKCQYHNLVLDLVMLRP